MVALLAKNYLLKTMCNCIDSIKSSIQNSLKNGHLFKVIETQKLKKKKSLLLIQINFFSLILDLISIPIIKLRTINFFFRTMGSLSTQTQKQTLNSVFFLTINSLSALIQILRFHYLKKIKNQNQIPLFKKKQKKQKLRV